MQSAKSQRSSFRIFYHLLMLAESGIYIHSTPENLSKEDIIGPKLLIAFLILYWIAFKNVFYLEIY